MGAKVETDIESMVAVWQEKTKALQYCTAIRKNARTCLNFEDRKAQPKNA